MAVRIRLCGPVICALIVTIIPAGRLAAQFNDAQHFEGTTDTYFAVSPRVVPYWGVDGSCSPALVYMDGIRGDNGSKCLQNLMPVGVGTRLIRDFNPGIGSATIGEMAATGIDTILRLWISADDGSGTNGQELYRIVDSLYGGIRLEIDIQAGTGSSAPAELYRPPAGFLGDLYFSADNGTNGREPWLSSTAGNLVVTNGLLADINPGTGSSNPNQFSVFGAEFEKGIVFIADDGTNGRELWKTDGTTTSLLMDINTSSAGASSDPQQMKTLVSSWPYYGPWDAKGFFTADDGVHGRELWRTDGTVSGTGMVKDIVVGATGSDPADLVPCIPYMYGSWVPSIFFTVDSDGANGRELWRSSGSLDGSDTELFIDVGATPTNITVAQTMGASTSFALFFTVGNDLWRSWGTPAGTNLIKTYASPPTNFTAASNMVYFAADDGTGSGVELWKSDGWTTTVQVKDVNPGSASSFPTNITAVGSTVYFSADDGTHGRELWRTDSTQGAVLAKDINPDGANSNPSNITNFDGTAVFTADDGTHGVELWQSDGFAAPGHVGMSYKWDLSADIQDRGDPSKMAVTGTDDDVFSIYWLFDFPAVGGPEGISEAAHQVNIYVELTDGTDRAPLDVTYVDCGDGNLTRPKAALTDGSNHNAIAFGMIAVLDQNPCDTDARGPGSPGVPFAYVPAVYDGHDWIPMDLVNFPAGVPTNPGTSKVMGETTTWAYMVTGWPSNLVAATEDPWQQKRFAFARLDVWDDYIAVLWGNKQYEKIWVATLPRQYKDAFGALYFGNNACMQPAYPFYLDTLSLNGGVFTTGAEPYGACCHVDSGICADGLTEAECSGTYTPWKPCSDPDLPTCCPTPWADPDNDDDVDQGDFGLWQACFSGSGAAYIAGCECYDRNDSTGVQGGDGDIDEDDFAWFANCVTGPTILLDVENLPDGCIP